MYIYVVLIDDSIMFQCKFNVSHHHIEDSVNLFFLEDSVNLFIPTTKKLVLPSNFSEWLKKFRGSLGIIKIFSLFDENKNLKSIQRTLNRFKSIRIDLNRFESIRIELNWIELKCQFNDIWSKAKLWISVTTRVTLQSSKWNWTLII